MLRACATNQCTKGVDDGGGEILQFDKESTEVLRKVDEEKMAHALVANYAVKVFQIPVASN